MRQCLLGEKIAGSEREARGRRHTSELGGDCLNVQFELLPGYLIMMVIASLWPSSLALSSVVSSIFLPSFHDLREEAHRTVIIIAVPHIVETTAGCEQSAEKLMRDARAKVEYRNSITPTDVHYPITLSPTPSSRSRIRMPSLALTAALNCPCAAAFDPFLRLDCGFRKAINLSSLTPCCAISPRSLLLTH